MITTLQDDLAVAEEMLRYLPPRRGLAIVEEILSRRGYDLQNLVRDSLLVTALAEPGR